MTDQKPVIGIVADVNRKPSHAVHQTQEKYLDAVTGGAGGLAFILPGLIRQPGAAFSEPGDIEAALACLDGVFLTGATSNVDPAHYGASLIDPESPADPARDHVSLALVRAATRRGIPVLGVCRGFQEINVALGGTLHQQVHNTPGFNDHREPEDEPLERQYGPSHPVRFAKGGLLHSLTGTLEAEVNSLHGQGVDRLAPGLEADAFAPDNLIEAFRGTGHAFLLAVQWHPEWLFRQNPISVAIFRAFGDAARSYRATRTGAPRSSAGLAA